MASLPPWVHSVSDQLIATDSINPGNLLALGSTSVDVTVAGAAVGDMVQVSYSQDAAGVVLHGYVRAADTVRVWFLNVTNLAVDLPAGTVKVCVTK